MQSLEKIDISMWADYEFSDAQMEVFSEHFHSFEDVIEFYNTWKRCPSKQLRSMKQGSIPKSRSHRDLAMEWDDDKSDWRKCGTWAGVPCSRWSSYDMESGWKRADWKRQNHFYRKPYTSIITISKLRSNASEAEMPRIFFSKRYC